MKMKKALVMEILSSFEDEFDTEKLIERLISVEGEKSGYNPEFVAKIEEGRKQVKEGKTRIVNIEKLAYDPDFVKVIQQGDEDIKAGKGLSVDIDKLF